MSFMIAASTAIYNVLCPRKHDSSFSQLRDYSVSAVVPVWNEKENIEDTIEHILSQDYNNLRNVIILDDVSTDGTSTICANLQVKNIGKVIHIRPSKNQGKGGNIDMLTQKFPHHLGDIIWIVDSDIRTVPTQLSHIIEYFDADDIGAVTGRLWPMKPERGAGIQSRKLYNARTRNYDVNAFKRGFQAKRNAIYTVVGANFAIKKDILLDVGLPLRTKTEDLDLCWEVIKHGYYVNLAPKVKSQSRIPVSFKDYYKQLLRWNEGSLQAAWIHKKDILKAAPSLSFTTLLPGYFSAFARVIYRASFPFIAYKNPYLAVSLLGFETLQAMIWSALISPKNTFNIFSYFIHSIITSATWAHGAFRVGRDILTGRSKKWGKKGWTRVKLASSEPPGD